MTVEVIPNGALLVPVAESVADTLIATANGYGDRTARGKIAQRLVDSDSVPRGQGYTRYIVIPQSLVATLRKMIQEAKDEYILDTTQKEALRRLTKKLSE